MSANFLRLRYMTKETDREIERKDLSHLRKLILKVESPTHYSCADNYHTHELEMTAYKLIVAFRE